MLIEVVGVVSAVGREGSSNAVVDIGDRIEMRVVDISVLLGDGTGIGEGVGRG